MEIQIELSNGAAVAVGVANGADCAAVAVAVANGDAAAVAVAGGWMRNICIIIMFYMLFWAAICCL